MNIRPSNAVELASALLSPVTLDAFLDRYWEREPLFVKGGSAKLASVIRAERLRELVEKRDKPVSAHFPDAGNAAGFRLGRTVTATIAPDQLDVAFAAGATISMGEMDQGNLDLARLVAALRVALGFTGSILCDAWLSPRTGGVPVHFDGSAVFTLQIEGSKRWRVSRSPALAWPDTLTHLRENGEVFHDGVDGRERHAWEFEVAHTDEREWLEVTLEPGDLLFIPAGVWHTTDAPTPHSLALNVRLIPDGFLDLLARTLRPVLRAAPEWRALPCADPRSGGVPRGLDEFFDARLADLEAHVRELRKDRTALVREWARSVAEAAGASKRIRTFDLLDRDRAEAAAVEIGEHTELQFRGGMTPTFVVERTASGDETLVLFVAGKEVTFDEPKLVPFGHGLARATRFTAADAARWSKDAAWQEIAEPLSALVAAGVLEALR
jgi:ribosomal protein L16 Arg81 hydroxylase